MNRGMRMEARHFYSYLILMSLVAFANPVWGASCFIQGREVGVDRDDRIVGDLTVVSKKEQESLSDQYFPADLAPLDYEMMTPAFREPLKQSAQFEYVRTETFLALKQMLTDAQDQGIELYVHSGFRHYQIQCQVFSRKVQKEMEEKQVSLEVAIQQVNTRSAAPGQSEHQLGSAVDLVTNIPGMGYKLEKEMQQTPAFEWLQKNAAHYGFVMSYPSSPRAHPDQPNPTTGYVYEPWHWRYVGVAYAMDMRFCPSWTPVQYLRAIDQNPYFRCQRSQQGSSTLGVLP